MNNINTTQVQLTNDASTVSKYSAVCKNYFNDDFIQEFVRKKKTRASIIHLGYYTRAFQIISCGSGFDTLYWRLSEANLLSKSIFIEIDFSSVIQKKISLIRQSPKLKSYISEFDYNDVLEKIIKINFNYYLLEADLSDLNLIEELFGHIHIAYDLPTLFLSECVITYMKESDKLIKWMAEKFENCAFINYEQIHSDDGFGQVMMKHFEKLQSPLFSVSKYVNCKSHYFRYKNLKFRSSFSISEWDALIALTTESERQRVFSLELFDEFEEFHLKCVHYVIGIAGNGVLCNWINLFPLVDNFISDAPNRILVRAEKVDCNLELFRHSSCYVNKYSYVFGGCSKQSRSSKIYKINYGDFMDINEIDVSGYLSILLDMVYGTAVYFEINKVPFLCLYGGRTSPNNAWNNGSPVIFELSNNKFLQKLVISAGNPISRYRTAMVSLNPTGSESQCWIFGGRATDSNHLLSDLWRLSIKYDDENNLTYSWKQYEKKKDNWPCSRMSHSFTACSERSELFIIGGLRVNSSSVLNDMWKWSCTSESWEKIQLGGRLLPRYGHTAHLRDDVIYLVGGVNTLPGAQPSLARIDLRNLSVVEYSVSLPFSEPVLFFNHMSEMSGYGDDAYIWLIGGGGNCFSFGTYLNRFALRVKLSCLN